MMTINQYLNKLTAGDKDLRFKVFEAQQKVFVEPESYTVVTKEEQAANEQDTLVIQNLRRLLIANDEGRASLLSKSLEIVLENRNRILGN